MDKGVVLQTIDLEDIVGFTQRKCKKFQAVMLSEIEHVVTNREQYLKIRKIILDGMNNYNRSILRSLFGDIEDSG